ncbi:hypothetical protein [Pirellulimonas nuda]|uniref:hypothetical protein n=1 Tax=Pirellulimonas nuda TaxID=2528009 RepID=UPI001E4E9644|nr:hypothetical protein [Pirellulimonas nuda]
MQPPTHVLTLKLTFAWCAFPILTAVGCGPEGTTNSGPTATTQYGSPTPPGLELDFPEPKILDNPTPENCVVITIVHAPELPGGAAIYRGTSTDEDSIFVGSSDEDMRKQIGHYVDQAFQNDDSKIGVMIVGDRQVGFRPVWLVQSAVALAASSSDRSVVVSVRYTHPVSELSLLPG